MSADAPFARLLGDAMARAGLGLRELCRRADADPSYLSKALSGKRSPPWDEDLLRRLARSLSLDEAELIVAAGRIPSEWGALRSDPDLFRSVNALASRSARRGRVVSASPAPATAQRSPRPALIPAARHGLSEELL